MDRPEELRRNIFLPKLILSLKNKTKCIFNMHNLRKKINFRAEHKYVTVVSKNTC